MLVAVGETEAASSLDSFPLETVPGWGKLPEKPPKMFQMRKTF